MVNFKIQTSFVLYTRFGLGVYDEEWLEFRIRAFETFTLASLYPLMNPNDLHLVFCDRDMPLKSKKMMREVVKRYQSLGMNLRMIFVDYHFEVAAVLDDILFTEFDGQPIYLGRVDDDDAFRFNTFQLVKSAALNSSEGKLLISNTWAAEYFPVERLIFKASFPHTVNFAYGPPAALTGYASVGHTSLPEWARKKNLTQIKIEDIDPVLLYNRHRQASSRFGSRRSFVREQSSTRTVTLKDLQDYNLDAASVNAFRLWAAKQPYAIGDSIWTVTQQKIESIHHAYIDNQKKKAELVLNPPSPLQKP